MQPNHLLASTLTMALLAGCGHTATTAPMYNAQGPVEAQAATLAKRLMVGFGELPAAGKLAVEGHTLLSGDEAGQAVSGGAEITPKDLGTKTSGTLTVNPADCPWQKVVHGAGGFTLDVAAHVNQCILELTNSSASGSITTSAFNLVDGDAFDNTSTSVFQCLVAYMASGKKSLSVRKIT